MTLGLLSLGGRLLRIKILLIDDHQIVREGIRSLIEKQPGMEVAAEAADGRMAVQLARDLSPDVIVIDVAMPSLNGIEATRRIVEEKPEIKVVALTMHSDERYVSEMFRAGASAYLLKDCAFEELCRAINVVVAGQFYISPGIAGIVVKDYVKKVEYLSPSSALSSLTPREREVLQLLAEGKTTKQIASDLHLSGKTIDTHRRQIMVKIGSYSIAELTKFAIREGLSSL